ncbi:hypothetical protein ST47_g8161 [Ascochyta rabiei]|uniref:Uncharacterized protein n=1 Tax=Didymella rabiei TaxID=5454 RepID=A0A162ZLV0_DIDRA|nr:hypothetical protein ST47_g8161 [Ascochyta rabiei]
MTAILQSRCRLGNCDAWFLDAKAAAAAAAAAVARGTSTYSTHSSSQGLASARKRITCPYAVRTEMNQMMVGTWLEDARGSEAPSGASADNRDSVDCSLLYLHGPE